MNKLNTTEEELGELLKDIQDYFLDNDLECGERGSQIYDKISKILGEEE